MNKRWYYFMISFALVIGLPFMLSLLLPTKAPQMHNSGVTTETIIYTQADETSSVEPYSISVLSKTGELIDMELDDYIVGVLLAEMPASFDMQALMAQAVVARTYTLKRLSGKFKHNGAAVCMDSACCQGFKLPEDYLAATGSAKFLDKVKSAVLNTSGEVLLYNNKLIEATYFSCSGGVTEDAVDVWGEDIPYLQSTQSPGEEKAKNYVHTEIFSLDLFLEKLGIKSVVSTSDLIGTTTYTAGGGVSTITIGKRNYKGTEIRQLLSLRSTAFSIAIVGDTVSVTTRGHGHRVGMSQYGAEAMAVQGSDYKQILQHYYKGTVLQRYY